MSRPAHPPSFEVAPRWHLRATAWSSWPQGQTVAHRTPWGHNNLTLESNYTAAYGKLILENMLGLETPKHTHGPN